MVGILGKTMTNPVRELERSKRRSAWAIPGHIIVLIALGLGLRWAAPPGWASALILVMGTLPLILDIANVVECSRELRRQSGCDP